MLTYVKMYIINIQSQKYDMVKSLKFLDNITFGDMTK